ncbi:MAG: hypothetical protein KGI08_10455 [Thaumarchaeota archaeon]|nr:hypothetical protein [Nitrososphaerota archaeon]
MGREQLNYKWERFGNVARELRPLVARYRCEIGRDYEPYNPDWNAYYLLDRNNSVGVWTARNLNGTLVGFILWVFNRSLHSTNTIFGLADLIYLAPEWRVGLLGYGFIKSGKDEASKFCNIIQIETNFLYKNSKGRSFGILLKRLGMRQRGEVWDNYGRR